MELENTIQESPISVSNSAISASLVDSVKQRTIMEVGVTLPQSIVQGGLRDAFIAAGLQVFTSGGQKYTHSGYFGYPIFIMSPDFSRDITYGCKVPQHTPDFLATNQPHGTMYADNIKTRFLRMTYTGLSVNEVSEVLGFIEARKGDLERFWVPSWTDDLGAGSISTGVRCLSISSIHVSNVNLPKLMWICDLDTGSFFITEVSIARGTTTSVVTMDNACPFSSARVMMGWMYLVRLSDDVVSVRYSSYTSGSIDLSLTEEVGLVYGSDSDTSIDRVVMSTSISGSIT